MTLSLLFTRLMLSFRARYSAVGREERGVTTVEYALVLVGIAAMVAAALVILRPRIEAMFNNVPQGGATPPAGS